MAFIVIISLFTHTILDAVSFFRVHGPLSELHKSSDVNVDLRIYTDEFNITKLKGSSIAFISKPYTEDHYKIIEACKECKVPVVVDFDDDYFNMPEYNQFHVESKKNKLDYKKWVKECLKLSDSVIVSTNDIKESYKYFNENITIINNCFDDYFFTPVKILSKNKIVLWRGSNSHMRDLFLFREQITELIRSNQAYTFVFWSNQDEYPAWLNELNREQTNVVFQKPVSPFYYFFWLKELNPFLTIVPLEDIPFNHSKSDLAKIEATASGCLCLAPNWDEWVWNSSDRYLYKDKKDFLIKADKILKNPEKINDIGIWDRNADWDIDVKYLYNNKMLSENNKKRLEVFKSVIK